MIQIDIKTLKKILKNMDNKGIYTQTVQIELEDKTQSRTDSDFIKVYQIGIEPKFKKKLILNNLYDD